MVKRVAITLASLSGGLWLVGSGIGLTPGERRKSRVAAEAVFVGIAFGNVVHIGLEESPLPT